MPEYVENLSNLPNMWTSGFHDWLYYSMIIQGHFSLG